MEITACPDCGAILKPKDKSCGSCDEGSSTHADTDVATTVTSSSETLSAFDDLLAKQTKTSRRDEVPGAKSAQRRRITLDVNDDDDNEAEDTTKHRNFSQSGAQSKGRSLQGPSHKSVDRGARPRRADAQGEATNAKCREKLPSSALVIAGLPISFGRLMLGICVIGLLVCATTYVTSNPNTKIDLTHQGGAGTANQVKRPPPMMSKVPRVEGRWSLVVEDQDHSFDGEMTLKQNGSELVGIGSDKVGQYSLTGYLDDGNTIFLTKRLVDQNNNESGASVSLTGKIDLYKVPLKAAGQWAFIRSSSIQSSYYQKPPAGFRGTWRANMIKSGSIPFPIPPYHSPLPPTKPSDIFAFLTTYGIWIALIIGAVAIGASFVLFGPSGLINIWNKQQYIPSQFKSQHAKVRAQLGRMLKKGSLPLGRRVEWKWYFPMPWVVKDLALPSDMRKVNPHVLILGQSGKGKTRLIARMIAHDIESNDRAVVCIDSDGTLVDLVTRWIAAHRQGAELSKRVIIIDPTSKGETLAFNPLKMPQRGDLQSAASSIVYAFKAIYDEPAGAQSQWNAQTADILRNSILLLMANDRTLLDLPALLQDNDFRDIMLESIEHRKSERVEFMTLLEQWGRYKKLARTDQWIVWVEPILNRLNPMLSNPRIRPILSEPDGDLKLNDVIVGKKILLVKLPQGQFGQDANLLGSLVVAAIKQAALTLNALAPKTQQEVALYLDGFDNFIEKENIANITSETKTFKIGMICVTKSLQGLPEDFRNELIINIGTLITFALAKKDGDMLGPQMFPIDGRKVKHQTMSNIFNRVNTSPQFELVSDEEKLNIDKIVRQEDRTFFCYRMGAEAGLFNLKTHPFPDIPDSSVNKRLLKKLRVSSAESTIGAGSPLSSLRTGAGPD